GSPDAFTAISSCEDVNPRPSWRISAYHVCVFASYWQRGALVNSVEPSSNASLTLNGPATIVPSVRKTVYAEFTISTTKPLPAHSPWSGGSNSSPKFVTSLSRLEVPLKFCSSP